MAMNNMTRQNVANNEGESQLAEEAGGGKDPKDPGFPLTESAGAVPDEDGTVFSGTLMTSFSCS